MSDSDKTNELDNYGVWVKKPPRTVSSETEEETAGTLSDISDDLPDFGSFDVPDSQETAVASGESEISLDEFIEGGVFEGDEESAQSTAAPAEENAGESVPADDFLASDDITISDTADISESAALPDDGPIDIDLSFDDSAAPAPASGHASRPEASEVPGSEDVDLSDFGVDFSDDDGQSSPSDSAAADDGTENVDLSDFGVDFSGDGDSSTAESETASGSGVNDDGTEEVSLDSFGFDINAEEQTQENSSAEGSTPIEDEQAPSLDGESPSPNETEDSFTVEADDDAGDISLEAEPSKVPEEEKSQDFSAPDDDDFDLDSIMDSIEDENGLTSSLNDAPETSAQEETIIEEPEVNDVVDSDEPVFEETAVDIPESDISEENNPFALPPDDAFAAAVTEEPPAGEQNDVPAETVIGDSDEDAASKEGGTELDDIGGGPVIEEDAQKEDIPSETVKSAENTQNSDITNNLLSQIAADLSSLRSEITNLKTDFEKLKNKESSAPAETAGENAPAESPEEGQVVSNGGFFGDEDDDDTIALSLDEMDNILSSAEIVEEEAPAQSADTAGEEVSKSAESLDFSNESIEEPVLDDIDTNIADEELPDEILVPKSDDIIVEPNKESLIEENSAPPAEEPASPADDPLKFETTGESTKLVDEPFVFEDSENEDAEEEPFDSFDDTTLSADELANIAADSGETGEDGGITISEGELDTLLTSEAAKPKIEEKEESEPVRSSIPGNLQKDIKSVLSYMDQLLENLPEEKIAEFAQSEQFETYKKLFKELGLD